jgi:hypothetical protein
LGVVGTTFLIFLLETLEERCPQFFHKRREKREKNPVLFWSLKVHFEEGYVNGHQPSWPGQNLSFTHPWSQHEE